MKRTAHATPTSTLFIAPPAAPVLTMTTLVLTNGHFTTFQAADLTGPVLTIRTDHGTQAELIAEADDLISRAARMTRQAYMITSALTQEASK